MPGIVDDMLKAMRHYEDAKVRMSDSEVITTAFVSILYFGGHQDNAWHFMQMQGYIPHMLDKSRYCRRLYRLADFSLPLFYTISKYLKNMVGAADYRLDSFPVAVCDNIRISRSKVLKGEHFRGGDETLLLWSTGAGVDAGRCAGRVLPGTRQ